MADVWWEVGKLEDRGAGLVARRLACLCLSIQAPGLAPMATSRLGARQCESEGMGQGREAR